MSGDAGSVLLYVAVVNYGRSDLTIDCLRTAVPEARAVRDRLGGCVIGLCDNGSGDDSVEALRSAILENGWGDVVEFVAMRPNRGFTGGNNAIVTLRLRSADAPAYVLLLNNDTVVREGAFTELLGFMSSRPVVGVAGGRLEDPDGTPQRCSHRFRTALSELEHHAAFGVLSRVLSGWVVAPAPSGEACEVDWVCGASLMIRREAIGGDAVLDDGYYTYFDDIDVCRRVKDAGWEVWHVPSSRTVHLGGMTTGIGCDHADERPKRRSRYWFESRRRYFLRHHGALHALLIDLCALGGLMFGECKRVVLRRRSRWPEWFWFDMLRESTLCRGFRVPEVTNPATGRPLRLESAPEVWRPMGEAC